MKTKQLLAALNRARVLSSLTKQDREDLADDFVQILKDGGYAKADLTVLKKIKG